MYQIEFRNAYLRALMRDSAVDVLVATTDSGGSIADSLDQWPDPEPGQVEVLLLGSYHMDRPGLDEVNVDADDVLSPARQAELRQLTDALERWAPDKVAVERPYDRREEVAELYEAYRTGEYRYDEPSQFSAPHPKRDDPESECRSEVVQIGFRLAERLSHDRVCPIDAPAMLENDDIHALDDDDFEPERKTEVSVRDPEKHIEGVDDRLHESTIPEFLAWKNTEQRLGYNHRWMFDQLLRFGREGNLGGPDSLSTWYDRNIRMCHYLWRALDTDDDRVLVVVGSGHVHILRHLLDESPSFCPVSALPVLAECEAVGDDLEA